MLPINLLNTARGHPMVYLLLTWKSTSYEGTYDVLEIDFCSLSSSRMAKPTTGTWKAPTTR